MHKKPFIYLNEKVLKLPEVHLIDDSGSSLGTMTSRQALNLAREKDLDLFVVSTTATPPIAKILNYGQYKYLENKRNKENSKPKQDTKELKISPRIQKHDIDTIIKISFPTIGEEKIKLMLDELSEYGSTADVIELKGKLMSVLMNPKK